MADLALVIGVKNYLNLRELEYTLHDAALMHQYFQEIGCERVFYFTDDSPEILTSEGKKMPTTPTTGNLRSFFCDFFQESSLNQEDNFWFFFSGHGARNKDIDYLMPYEGNYRDLDSTAISVKDIIEYLQGNGKERQGCGAGNIILLLDACRNQGQKAGLGISLDKYDYPGVITISSCRSDECSYEISELEHGAFTFALEESLRIRGSNSCATVEKLVKRLKGRVQELTQKYQNKSQSVQAKIQPISMKKYILLPQEASREDIRALEKESLDMRNKGNRILAGNLDARLRVARFYHNTNQISLTERISGNHFSSFFSEQETLSNRDYIERPPIEEYCLKVIRQPGALLRIRAPRRMGKTCLIDKILASVQNGLHRSIKFDFSSIEKHILEKPKTFLQWFCAFTSIKLGLEINKISIEKNWEKYPFLGDIQNCTFYFEDNILKVIDSYIILALDNADSLFEYTESSKIFFIMLRKWHEDARIDTKWQKVHLILSYGTEEYLSIPEIDINYSPFNVGFFIELSDFSAEQIRVLAERQGVIFHNDDIKNLQSLIGGHPYLIQRAITSISTQAITLEELLDNAATESGIYANHLRSLLALLKEGVKEHKTLKESIDKVIDRASGAEYITLSPEDTFYLERLGLVKVAGNNVCISIPIYQKYLKERWAYNESNQSHE